MLQRIVAICKPFHSKWVRSAETTLNIYSHITDTMRLQTAVKIDREIRDVGEPMSELRNEASQTISSEFDGFVEPYKLKIRKSGTGCVTMINERLYEGWYSSKINGKRMARNVYVKQEKSAKKS